MTPAAKALGFLDGPDGSGKSTLLTGLIQYLEGRGVEVCSAPILGDFLPAASSAAEFRDWVLSNDGLVVGAALIEAACRRLEVIGEAVRCSSGILLVDRGPLTVRLSAVAHGTGAGERSESEVLAALSGQLEELAVLRSRIMTAIPSKYVVILPRLGMDTIVNRLRVREVISGRYLRYLTVLNELFHVAPLGGSDCMTIAAEDELRANVTVTGELLLGIAR